MARRTPSVPDKVFETANATWGKWRDKIVRPDHDHDSRDRGAGRRYVDPDAGKPPEQRMIEKIRRRMVDYPEWYETDPDRVAALVSRHLDRIGHVLERELPNSKDPVQVWQVPLSVFNWLEDSETGTTFRRAALCAWPAAEAFNTANAASLSDEQKSHKREPFIEISPLLLTAVLEALLKTGLSVTFAKKFVGPEFKYLVMRVE